MQTWPRSARHPFRNRVSVPRLQALFLPVPSPVLSPLLLLALAWSAPGCRAPAPDASGGPPPNLLVFLVDDLGWQDLSLPLAEQPTPFNEVYRTPNVERLAARGLTFTQAYAAAPVCTPTRTSLMTGLSPAANHITYWILHGDRDTSAKDPATRPPAWNIRGLQPGDVTLPALLSASGYRTIHVGKAHLGAKGTPGDDPRALGFDVNIAGHGAGGPANYYGSENFAKDSIWDIPGLEAYHGQDIYLTEALALEADGALRDAVAAGQPFFLHMAPYAVHAPIQPNPRYEPHYPSLPAREQAYATMIESVDAALGRLLDTLDELDIADETLVVFTSDNGGLSAHARDGERHTHNAPLRSGKGSSYEGGVRVPAVVAGPGVRVGRDDTPIITQDLFPTLLAYAGVREPEAHGARVEGRDLRPLFGDPRATLDGDLYWHQPHYWGVSGPGIWPYSAIRHGDWKLVYRHRDGGFELYDLGHDLGEQRDLADERPEVVRDLAQRLQDWLERVGAQMPTRDDGQPVPGPAAQLASG